ncbi:TIGR02584 family CRISPR-associated protein [bacterium]|nr:TIGR02584 family CRISPR-associated protein [bacterium]
MRLSHHHILFAVLGRTPQILTETLYALCVVRRIPIHEVWAVSTHEGRQDAIQKLLDPVHGQLYQLQQDYPAACGQVRFAPENIIVAEDHLMPIPDIRTRQHSETFLELILRELWKKTADPNLVLHCSLAGGRKTMSTYLALALQLLARPQDALYHVLVDPPELEHHGGFYYPPPCATPIVLGDGRTLDAGNAHIDLIDIPFIRLRERMQIYPNQSPAGYRQLLEWVQSNLDQSLVLPQLLLDVKNMPCASAKAKSFCSRSASACIGTLPGAAATGPDMFRWRITTLTSSRRKVRISVERCARGCCNASTGSIPAARCARVLSKKFWKKASCP